MNNLTYDQALARLQAIISQLEQEEALSVTEYKALAKEAKLLLAFCREQLTGIEKDIRDTLS